MKAYKRTIMILLTAFLVLSSAFPVFADVFRDIDGHWAEEYIKSAQASGIVEGYEDGSFKPEGKITRAEFYTMVNRFGEYGKKAEIHFADVDKSDWFYDEVAKGVAVGYLRDSDGKLNPDSYMIRDEAARIIASIYNLKGDLDEAKNFDDSDSIIYMGQVGALTKAKILNGYPDGNFRPTGTITRGEFAKILYLSQEILGLPDGKADDDFLEEPLKPIDYNALEARCPGYRQLQSLFREGKGIQKDLRAFDYTSSEKLALERELADSQKMIERMENHFRKTLDFDDFYEKYKDVYNSDKDEAYRTWNLLEQSSFYKYSRYSDFYNSMKKYGYPDSMLRDIWSSVARKDCPYSAREVKSQIRNLNRAISAVTKNKIKITFVDRLNNVEDTTYINRGDRVRRQDPVFQDKIFQGWTDVSGNDVDLNKEKFYENTTLQAKWDETVKDGMYTLIVKENDDDYGVAHEYRAGEFVTIKMDDPEQKFDRWETDPETPLSKAGGNDPTEYVIMMPSYHLTVTAKWK